MTGAEGSTGPSGPAGPTGEPGPSGQVGQTGAPGQTGKVHCFTSQNRNYFPMHTEINFAISFTQAPRVTLDRQVDLDLLVRLDPPETVDQLAASGNLELLVR